MTENIKRNKFREHIPSFHQRSTPPLEFYFDDTKELLEHPAIQRWKKDLGKTFYRFSISDNLLMSEENGGKNFWVMGYIDHPELIDLPTWEYPKKRGKK